MKIENIAKSPSFCRALCTREEQELKNLTKEALGREHLGIDTVSTTFFDFTIPAGEYNTGIGTTFSKEGIDTAEFANIYFGTTNIQVGPQGKISNLIRSPYSGTTFSLGEHNISPEKLATKEYENLLSQEDIDESEYMNTVADEDTVDYEHVFSDERGIKSLLLKAYENFTYLPEDSKLVQEFYDFVDDNEYWIERDSVFEAIAHKYGTDDVSLWSDRDKNIYADENNIDYGAIDEYMEAEDEFGNNIVEFNEFIQFIADKQQQQTKEELNKMGISLTGDCPIGFSAKDVWAHKSAFYQNGGMFGCDTDGKGKLVTCWTEAPDMSKLDGEAGELFRQKFATMFKRNNAIRVDAAWQLIYPTIVTPTHKDKQGNMLGKITPNQPEVGDKIINILKETAKESGIPENKISLELLDGAGKSWKSLSNPKIKKAIENMNCIHTMQYIGDSWGYPSHYRSSNAGPFKHSFEISIGTHDDKTAITSAEGLTDSQLKIIAKELKKDKSSLSTVQEKVAALFALLFTHNPNDKSNDSGKVSITVNDAVGSPKRINTPNTKDGNWEFRLNRNWQSKYFNNLTQGFGLNLPEALSTALKAKEGESELTHKLDRFAQVLKSDGPMTRGEANAMAQEGTIDTVA